MCVKDGTVDSGQGLKSYERDFEGHVVAAIQGTPVHVHVAIRRLLCSKLRLLFTCVHSDTVEL